jgi:hypothetical protein
MDAHLNPGQEVFPEIPDGSVCGGEGPDDLPPAFTNPPNYVPPEPEGPDEGPGDDPGDNYLQVLEDLIDFLSWE